MRLSGRELTLLSVYGAGSDGKSKGTKKPQRPPPKSSKSARTKGTNEGVRHFAASVHSSGELQRCNEEVNKQETHIKIESTLTQLQAPTNEAAGEAANERSTASVRLTGIQAREAKAERSTTPAVTSKSRSAPPGASENAVISLYGDGFLEIPVVRGDAEGGTSPLQSIGDGGFSINMLLFKAADTEKLKAKV